MQTTGGTCDSEGSRESKDADLDLLRGADGGVCMTGVRGDELLFSSVRNL